MANLSWVVRSRRRVAAKALWFGSVLGAAAIFAGCGSSASAPSAAADDGGVTLQSNVVVLSDDVVAQATITRDAIEFPEAAAASLAGISAGTVIVSGYGEGFLRRVTSVDSPIVLHTVQAVLTDAIASGDFDWTFRPNPVTASATNLLAGNTTAGLTLGDVASITPTIEVKGQIRGGKVTAFLTTVTTTTSDSVSAAIALDAGQTWSGSVPVASATQPFVGFLGPVPVVVTVSESLAVGYSVGITARAQVSVAATCSLTHTDSLDYSSASGWSSSDTTSEQCTHQGPTADLDGSAQAKVFLSPTIGLAFYGVAGPSVSAQIGVEASLVGCPPPSGWSVDGYVSGSVAASISVFGVGVSFSHDLGTATYPVASGTLPTPAVCAAGPGVDAGADAGDDDDDDGDHGGHGCGGRHHHG